MEKDDYTLLNKLERCTNDNYKANNNKIIKAVKRPKLIINKILHIIVDKILKGPVKMKIKLFWGNKMLVVFPECVSEELFLYGYFEKGLTCMVLEYLKKDMIFC